MSKNDTDNDYLFLRVGALLHDIGHFVPNPEGSVKGHADRGFDFLNSFTNTKDFSVFAKYHHARSIDEIEEKGLSQKHKSLIWMVREASRLSLGDNDNDGEDVAEKHLLKSIFSGISGIKEESEGKKLEIPIKYYPSEKLNPSTFTYPLHKEDSSTLAEEGCRKIYESFGNFFSKLTELEDKLINEDLLLMFLEENTTFIPAGSGTNNDISLFDHLKTTCVIASCMYKSREEELEGAEKYLLVGGDVSGIQDFIYRISSKGALRLLRGRSFYLEMFCEDIVQNIVEELGLPKANILYSGGGNFYILAPNTQEAKDTLKNIESRIEKWLIDNRLSSSLYLALSWFPFSDDKFKNFSQIWVDVNQKNSLKKARKYQSVLETDPSRILKLEDYGEPCDACRKTTLPEKRKPIKGADNALFCQLCHEQMEIGQDLANLGDSFCILKTGYQEGGFSVPFGTMKIMEKVKIGTVRKSSSIYSVNSLDTDGIINLMKSKELPPDIHVSSLPIAIYCAKSDDRGNGRKLLTFEELADRSQGAKKLGAVRMDVDSLGGIFISGLPPDQRNITRISSLSRRINYFFKNYLNLLGEFKEEKVLDICNWKSNSPKLVEERKPSRNFSIVYAGGDDLFILGAWDDVFELCFHIEGLFHKYVAENPQVTISAGFSIFNSKHPLYQIASVCGNKEECSKDEGRDRIYLLNRGVAKEQISKKLKGVEDSVSWGDARDLFADFRPIFGYIINENENSSKAIVRKLLATREEYCRDPEKANWVIQLHYFVSQNKDMKKILDNKRHEELRKYFYSVYDDRLSPIYNIDLALNILDLLGRKVNS